MAPTGLHPAAKPWSRKTPTCEEKLCESSHRDPRGPHVRKLGAPASPAHQGLLSGLSGALPLGGDHCRAGRALPPKVQCTETGITGAGQRGEAWAADCFHLRLSERSVQPAQVTQTGSTCKTGRNAQSRDTHHAWETGLAADGHTRATHPNPRGSAGVHSLGSASVTRNFGDPRPAI